LNTGFAVIRGFTITGKAGWITDDLSTVQWFSFLDLEAFLARAESSVTGSDSLSIGDASLAVIAGGTVAGVAVWMALNWSACTSFEFEFVTWAFSTLVLVWTSTSILLAAGIADIWLAVEWVIASF